MNVIQHNPLVQNVLNQIYVMDLQYRVGLDQKFRALDMNNQGIIKKLDFFQVIENSIRSISRDDLIQTIDTLVPPSETTINYGDFMKILYMYGEKQQQPAQSPNISLQVSQENPLAASMGAALVNNVQVERIKAAYASSNLAEELRKRSKNNDDNLSLDSFILALSMVKGVSI